jgi:tetratricopeptide (TPR) repeat protein
LTPENVRSGRLAEASLRRALELDAHNRSAFVLLGVLARNDDRLEDAFEWYRRAMREEPGKADTWCALGGIRFQLWFRHGQPPDELEELIREFEKAVELDPTNETAMGYLSIMLRQRAAMTQNAVAAGQDLAASKSWHERAVAVYSDTVQTSIAERVPHPLESDDPDAYLNFVVSIALTPAPPPPPPPPAPPASITADQSIGEAVLIFEPRVEGVPRPVRVPPAIQEQRLTTKVEPQLAPDAESQTPLRFIVVIGRDGHIVKDIFIDGNPWLRRAAVAALRQWVYEPTVVNGQPVEVVTEVWVGRRQEK